MGERKGKQQLEKLKKKYGVDILWSFSRYNAYKTDPYGYMLKYIRHEPETRQNIYGISGGFIHDIIQGLYDKQVKYDEMLTLYEDKLYEMNVAELKYDRNDEEKNKNIADKYEENIRLFFQQHKEIPYKMITEQFVTIKIYDYIFQGYIDAIYKDENGIYNIIDWKSSTIYVGAKVIKEAKQLILYAESLIQKGVQLENIMIKWNFLKYCTVEYQLKGIDKETKLHKTKTRNSLRTEWVKGLENNIKMWLGMLGYDELEIEDMVQTAIENNSMDNLPQELQDRYKMTDCYVNIPLTQEIIDELKDDIKNTLDEITEKTEEYKKTKDDKLFWTDIDKSNEYYFYSLCPYSSKQHLPFKEYLDIINMFITDYCENNQDNDMKWLDDL
ncbi:PD-(D/E)XK nuclease family protein [Clostridium sp.]|uniref:PD-(D/E)XK nuclease family protein n=1 Tax=Clostridium sp. TaxID=1506 RepID=UPI00260197D9|nr:PD-(D/E)XK nuclease family protein [Clostridium sp.]